MLEDDFCDVLGKALRGNRLRPEQVASQTGLEPPAVARWLKGPEVPDEDQSRALARVLALDPGKLADAAARRWHPPDISVDGVRHHPQDPHPSNGYVFFLENGRSAALVDPAGIPQNLIRMLKDGPFNLEYLLITHKHPDHCDATADVYAAFPQAKIVMHKADVAALGPLAHNATPIVDGEELPFAEDMRIRMLHTPGHTDGSSCFLFRSTLFSGDTLFAGSVGGAYGDRSTYADILNSVRSKLFTLPEDTVVMPGHGPPSTVAEEKAHNPFFPNA